MASILRVFKVQYGIERFCLGVPPGKPPAISLAILVLLLLFIYLFINIYLFIYKLRPIPSIILGFLYSEIDRALAHA